MSWELTPPRMDIFILGDVENDNEEGQDERLQKLAVFQLSMIKHAMKCSSKSLSTCMIYH